MFMPVNLYFTLSQLQHNYIFIEYLVMGVFRTLLEIVFLVPPVSKTLYAVFLNHGKVLIQSQTSHFVEIFAPPPPPPPPKMNIKLL